MEQLNHKSREVMIDLSDVPADAAAEQSGDAASSGEPHIHHRRGDKHRRRRKKKMSKTKKVLLIILIVLLSLLLLAAIAAFALYHYMFGTLTHDSHVRNLSDDALGIVEVEDGLDRNTIKPSASGMVSIIETDEIPLESVDVVEVPDEVQDILEDHEQSQTSHLLYGADRIQCFVLFGLDAYNSSDSIIVVAVDPIHQKIKLISIARDTYVMIPKWGAYSKLTYAYHWGGAALSLQTLNQNLYLNLRNYAAVDFEQMEAIIDLVGGVTVDLSSGEIAWLRHQAAQYNWTLTEGECLLNGALAVSYARIRSSDVNDNDESRAGRQREILLDLLRRGKAISYTDYPKFVRECMALCTTSFTNSEVLELCTDVLTGSYSVEQYFFPNDATGWRGTIIDGHWYYVYDLDKASDLIYRIIYEDLYVSGYSN